VSSHSQSAFALVLVLLLAGVAARRLSLIADEGAEGLNRFVIYVCMPALILELVPKLTLHRGLLVLVAVPWLLLLVSVPLVLAASRALRLSREATGALLLCVPVGNTSFLGYPMVGALLGEPAVRLAVVYDQLGSFLIVATWGTIVAARYGSASVPGRAAPGVSSALSLRSSVRTLARRVVLFPPFVALAIALLPWHLPPSADPILKRVGDALVPVAMFTVGLKLELGLGARDIAATAMGLAIKMGALPLIALGLAVALHAQGDALRVVTLESAMPPMITAGAMAMSAQLRPRLAAALVGYGILAAIAILPLWALVR